MPQKSLFMRLLPLLLTVAITFIVVLLILTKPKVKRGAPPAKAELTVTTSIIREAPFTIDITSYGRIEATIRTQLRAQVGGKITFIHPGFNAGGKVNQGDTLIEIEKADYRVAMLQAKATYIDAKRLFDEETARAAQAQSDWRNTGRTGKPADLVLRKPQIAAAQAQLTFAQAALEGAELNLKRATITSPYTARVINRQIDPHQVISANTVLGEIFSTDTFEVTLPIRNSDASFLQAIQPNELAEVTTRTQPRAKLTLPAHPELSWDARIVRQSANIDEISRQSFVVAQFQSDAQNPQSIIKLGQYVTAQITGKTFERAIVIPNSSIYQGNYVYTVNDNKLFKRPITPLWQSPTVTMVKSGLKDGDEIVTSPLGQVTSGTRIKRENDTEQARPQKSKPSAITRPHQNKEPAL